MKVNLGSGMCPIRGYLNVDVHPLAEKAAQDSGCTFMKWSVTDLPLPWESDSIEEVRCENLFDSLDRRQFNELLREIHRVLRRGGALVFHQGDVAVNPDMCIGWPGFVSGYTHHLFRYYTVGDPAWSKWKDYYGLPGFVGVDISHNASGVMIGKMVKP